MKRFFLIVTLVGISALLGISQDWSLFPLNQTSYYKVFNNPGDEFTYNVEKLTNDTFIQNGNKKHYFFNTKQGDYIDCLSEVNFSQEFYYINSNSLARPDSFIINNDTMYFMKSGNTYPIPVFAQPGDTIPFQDINGCTIYLTCDSIYLDSFLLTTDSVKLFCLNIGYGNDFEKMDALLLSKNHGILKFWQFIDDQSLVNQYQVITLKGFDKQGDVAGLFANSFEDFFHLSVGDILFWKYSLYDVSNWPQEVNVNYRYKDEIDSIASTIDSLIYYYTRYYVDSVVNVKMGFNKENFLRLINMATFSGIDQVVIDQVFYHYISLYSPTYNYDNSVLRMNFNSFEYYDFENCNLWGLYGGGIDFSIDTQVGLCSYGSYSSAYSLENSNVDGGVINGVSFGNTTPIGMSDINKESEINIYPNPFRDFVIIDLIDNSDIILDIELYNITGQLVLSKSDINKSIIELERQDLPTGYYIIKIRTQNEKLYINSLIVDD